MAAVQEKEFRLPDAALAVQTLSDIAQKSPELIQDYISRHINEGHHDSKGSANIAEAFLQMSQQMLANPSSMVQAQVEMWQGYADLWAKTTLNMLGHAPSAAIEPIKGDRRFKHDDWNENAAFDFIKQSYLLTAQWMNNTVAATEGLDEQTLKKVTFYTQQFTDALAPSNFAITNPEVLRETLISGGENLLRGLANMLSDMEGGKGKLKISMTDSTAFELGVNVAATPCKVVYETDLMQLLQYEPATEKVHKKPLLIVPPWINKFYILDLRAKNSLIKWCVDQGFTVFVVSWVNPDAKLAEKDFEDYLRDGTLAAIDAVSKATGEKSLNAVGYCLGGTLLGSTAAYLTAKGDKRLESCTYLTTMLDFADPGELGVFIDEEQIQSLEKRMEKRGFLEGSEMATTFNMLRANDLIWSFYINNYLLGKSAFPFDLLYWNSDSTRMPAKMHSYYLRNMYQHNRLSQPNGLNLNGVDIDISKVETPSYFLSAADDHIAPWKTTYEGAKLFAGPVKFVLGGSGHIAGVVNPPESNKYGYRTNDKLADSSQDWLDSSTENEGSWWTDWAKWVGQYSGAKTAARVPGDGGLKVLEDGPGSYVKARITD